MAQTSALYGTRVGGAILILAAFWVAGSVGKRIVSRLADAARPGRQEVLRMLARCLEVAMIVVGAVSALGTLGVDVTAMVAGLGLTGFALGFALRDVLSNVVSGMLVLIYRPFGRGDTIAVAGLEGRVTSIDLRYTTLEGERGRILIPNATLFTNSVVVRPADAA